MKRLILIITTAFLANLGFSQGITYLSSSTGTGEVRNILKLDKQLNNSAGDSVLTTTPTGIVKLKYINSAGSYTLPFATPTVLGGIKVGTGLSINSSTGVLSATGGGSGEPVITAPNTPKRWYNGYKQFVAANSDSLNEGSTNLFYTNARVQTFGDSRYSLLGHNHSFDGLSNVTMTGKATGDIPQWNGSAWVKFTPNWITGNQTITLSGDLSGSGTTSIAATISTASVGNAKLANVPTATFKGRITSGTGVPEDLTISQTKTALSIDNVNNTSDVSKPISTAVQNALNLKANLTNPAFLGIPTAPTATNGTNTTQIATTAFVIANSNAGGSGYVLPIAGTSNLGGVKVGSGLSIDVNGILSTTVAGGVSSFNGRTASVLPALGDYTTNLVPEGGGVLYFTNGRAITSLLTGFSSGAGTVSSSDNILQAIQKIVGNLAATNTTVAGKANTSHTHPESDVTGLVSDLAGKADVNATWPASSITSGVLSSARLGTGTANSNTVLYGDGTFKPVPIIDTVRFASPLVVVTGSNGKDSVVYRPTINTKTANYTLTLSDAGTVLTFNSTSALTVTVPTGLPQGFSCRIIQINTGQVSIVGSSTTVNNPLSGTKIAHRFGEAEILSYTTNVFVTKGDLIP